TAAVIASSAQSLSPRVARPPMAPGCGSRTDPDPSPPRAMSCVVTGSDTRRTVAGGDRVLGDRPRCAEPIASPRPDRRRPVPRAVIALRRALAPPAPGIPAAAGVLGAGVAAA